MLIKSAFSEKAKNIGESMGQLLKHGSWKEDLEVAIEARELNDKQIDLIKQNATQSCFTSQEQDSIKNSTTFKCLTHAFCDPVGNLSLAMRGLAEEDEETLLKTLISARAALADIAHNYPLILGTEMTGHVKNIITIYQEQTIPELDELILQVSQKTNIDPTKIKPEIEQLQHIKWLPEEPFL